MRRHHLAVLAAALVLAAAACSSNGGSSSTTTAAASVPATAAVADDPPRVDLIAPAIAAVEAKLGGPQEFFEINATSHLVNLWVSLNDGALAQNWLYLDDGTLTSKPAQDAQGHSFPSSAVTFDPDTVLSQVGHDLPDATLDLFVIEGGAAGTVRYTVVSTSAQGGQLQIVVDPTGKVLVVTPDTDADTGSVPG